MVVYGFGQKKLWPHEQPSGIAHAVVFWGFVVLLLQVITLFGRSFDADWSIPGFAAEEPLGPPFFLARDLLEACVIVGVTYMLYRRLVLHVPRLFGLARAEQRYRDALHWEGILILVLILLIVVGGLLYDAPVAWSPTTSTATSATSRCWRRWPRWRSTASAPRRRTPSARSDGGCTTSRSSSSSLSFSPLSKHFHVITAIPNLFFAKLPPRSADLPLAITHVPAAPAAALEPPAEGAVGVVSPST